MVDPRSGNDSTIIHITGSGTCPQHVDKLMIDAGLSNFSTHAGHAMRENAEVMSKLRSELERFEVDPKDIRTRDLRLSPTSERDNERRVEIRGFRAQHRLNIVFRDVQRSGEIIDALVEAGATEIQGPALSRVATEAGLQIARAAAIRDANARASFFAETLGLRVKRLVTMREGQSYAGPAAAMSASSARATTQFSLGEDMVFVQVQGEYELVP